ncbi:hypothetical protein EDD30_7704 [Couchioplanes caeruleus]|uniref:Uncharacterized protein n=1 Tax=Couchioplanes caeruleus TaxID=56438 RepID=A0A3N1FTI4_9ACTN|nr:hypothetical protein EDD30_7704 [Couchioplanes caeruleus]
MRWNDAAICQLALSAEERIRIKADWLQKARLNTGLGDMRGDCSGRRVPRPNLSANALSLKVVTYHLNALLPWGGPGIEAAYFYEAAVGQRDQARPQNLCHYFPGRRLSPSQLPQGEGRVLERLEDELFSDIQPLTIAHGGTRSSTRFRN